MCYQGIKVESLKVFFLSEGSKMVWTFDLKTWSPPRSGTDKSSSELGVPATSQDLQQFVCALGWMRMSIPGHNKLTQPLMDLLEEVYRKAGGRSRRQVLRVKLADVGWTSEHTQCLHACKEALGNAVELAHVKANYPLSVFTDASESYWEAIVSQIPPDHKYQIFSEQHHEPLMFLSGTFSGSALSWAIVEKEAFAIAATCQRADYLLHRQGGFSLYTDHRNFRFIFNPSRVLSSVPKYTADKLQR